MNFFRYNNGYSILIMEKNIFKTYMLNFLGMRNDKVWNLLSLGKKKEQTWQAVIVKSK